jgi:calmodulin
MPGEVLTEDHIAVFREEFNIFDKDSSGSISATELGSVLRSLGIQIPESEINKMLSDADIDHSGQIDFKEFLAMMNAKMTVPYSDAEIVEAFKAFDADHSGFVSAEELSTALACLGPENFSQEEIEELLASADKDGDGNLDYEEFVKLFRGYQ